jgi:peptidoglycan/LPS O-acetylase OafA/YrhL
MNSLDGLRGFAVLLVFLAHASYANLLLAPGIHFIGNGRAGVYLFFVLSAFLLTYPFLHFHEKAYSRHFILNYSVRRIFRIFPLYSACLLCGFLSTILLQQLFNMENPRGFPLTLTFQEFIRHLSLQEGKGVTWSIVVEFHFYLFLPILAFVFSRILRNNLLACGLLTLCLIVVGQMIWPQAATDPVDIRLGPFLPLFLMGSYLALLHHRWQNFAYRNAAVTYLLLEVLGILALALTICMIPLVASWIQPQAEIKLDQYHRAFIQFGILWSVVLFATVNGNGVLKRIFEWRFLRYLGFISFSIYLLHLTAIAIVKTFLLTHTPLDIWIAFALTILISHLTWRIIEKPSSRIKIKPPETRPPIEAK